MKKNKLINIRKTKKVSQADIATYLKISQAQYQKRESGKIKITSHEWFRIASLLDVPIESIYEDHYSLEQKSLYNEIVLLKEKIKKLEHEMALIKIDKK
ncbi:helix-turn-helix transcriptional regulator [Chryseobacterium sp. Leaf201]|uniref:helix-turn-helix transcriptional regulator n=1 Tax=Chryseobacterium sp. Leaf201 TaxID=1735672 RepID=UPI0006F7E8D8|nr:helix-turn-helix transcriptional regulator [Chryseobacterium sp. Leaf201]KQM41703.1 hypothetical protein ASE55_03570 [Chryseobacterium sp. Leaf201]